MRLLPYPALLRLALWHHVLLGVLSVAEPQVHGITSVYMLTRLGLVGWWLAGAMGLASGLAWIALRWPGRRWRFLALMALQQNLMYVSALGAMLAAWQGSYGDGVAHPRLFIFADQVIYVLLAYYHTRLVMRLAGMLR